VHAHTNHPIELHGEHGSLQVPDPNTFGGPVKLRRARTDTWEEQPLVNGYVNNSRGIGAADLATSLLSGRPQRCHSDLALHVLEVMQALHESAERGEHIRIESRCERPTPLPSGVADGDLGEEL
jgi:predicted dehydrogenase